MNVHMTMHYHSEDHRAEAKQEVVTGIKQMFCVSTNKHNNAVLLFSICRAMFTHILSVMQSTRRKAKHTCSNTVHVEVQWS